MHWGVLRDFHQGKESGLDILLTVAEGSEVLFNGVVLPLSQADGLQVEGGQESVVSGHVGADWSLESAVGEDIVLYAVFADHVLQEHTCLFQWVDIVEPGQVDRHLSYSIDCDQYPGVTCLGWFR